MKRPSVTRYLAFGCARAAGNVVLWSSWLVLSIVAIFLIRVAVMRRVEVPHLVLERLQKVLLEQGYDLRCSEANFDTGGHIILKDALAGLSGGNGPRLKAARIDTTVDLWKLSVGMVKISSLRVTGAQVVLPPMISPTGSEFAVVDDLRAIVVPGAEEIDVPELSFRVGKLLVIADGSYALPKVSSATSGKVPGPTANYPESLAGFAKAVAGFVPYAERFDNPTLTLHLRAGEVRANFSADHVHWPAPDSLRKIAGEDLDVQRFNVHAQVPLAATAGTPLFVETTFEKAQFGTTAEIGPAKAKALMVLANGNVPAPVSLDFSATSVRWKTLEVGTPSLHVLFPGKKDQAQTSLSVKGVIWEEPFSLEASGIPGEKSGLVHLGVHISASLLKGLAKDLGKDFTPFLQPEGRAPAELDVLLGKGGNLDRVSGWFSSGPVVARHVPLRGASADLSLIGNNLLFDRIILRTPSSEARGSYWMDTSDYSYRFLLEGGLMPMDIAGWFKEWWPHFWDHFEFSTPALANVDVQGRWGYPDSTSVFVGAHATGAAIQKVPFDRVETNLLVRSHHFDGYRLVLESGAQRAEGTFARVIDPVANEMSRQSFNLTSNLDLGLCARLFGKDGDETISPFLFETPPQLTLTGYFNGPGNPEGPGRDIDVKIRSTGEFRFHRFPLQDFSGDVHLTKGMVDIKTIDAHFAGGSLHASAKVMAADQAITLEGRLTDATLGSTIQIVENHLATDPAKKSTFGQSKVQQKLATGLLTLNFAGTGNLKDPYSYVGQGTAGIKGAELAEINMLGELSRILHGVPLLGFTTMSLNTLDSRFELKGNKVEFPYFRISGPSARLSSVGSYDLKAKKMSFDVAVLPFAQNSNVFASAMNIVFTPLSAALELHLEGGLDDPKWHFALGPTGILRRINSEEDKDATTPPRTAQPPPLLRRH